MGIYGHGAEDGRYRTPDQGHEQQHQNAEIHRLLPKVSVVILQHECGEIIGRVAVDCFHKLWSVPDFLLNQLPSGNVNSFSRKSAIHASVIFISKYFPAFLAISARATSRPSPGL